MMRVFIALAAWCALGASGYFLFETSQKIADRQTQHREFQSRLNDVTAALGDARAAQYAYVAEGQNVATWAPRASAYVDTAVQNLDALRQSATAGPARRALMESEARLTEVASLERRAREYLSGGNRLMASDVLFTAGAATLEETAQLMREAGNAEQAQFVLDEAAARRDQIVVAAVAAAFLALAIALLALVRTRTVASAEASASGPKESKPRKATKDMSVLEALRNLEESDEYARVIKTPKVVEAQQSAAAPVPVADHAERHEPLNGYTVSLTDLANLCVDLDSVDNEDRLKESLARAAALTDAPRLAVWLEDTASGAFQPVTAHGYSPQALARMPAVPRDADNAVAHASQSCSLQVVAAPAPGARGALVAPLVSAGTAFGVVTVELPDGRESSPSTQAVVRLLATQLSHVFAPVPVADTPRHAQSA